MIITITEPVYNVQISEPARAITFSSDTVILAGGGGVTDHGELTGLEDDDHLQYHNDTRGDARYYQKAQVDQALAGKVDNVTGKQLSTEDYTTAEKSKLAGIAPGATANQTNAYLLARVNHTGTQTANTISDFSTAADARITAQKGVASGLATLDTNSKIPTSQLPAIAITSTFVVNSQAAQLALTVQEGDVAVRTDLSKSYIHNGGTSGTMADWQELLTPINQVQSVNGQTGTVILSKSDVGLGNVDNTADLQKPVSNAQQTALNGKVDKVTGKQLSTEDYTTTEKTKLSGIAPGATANQSDAYLLGRINHTGTQTAATISDFSTAADARITAQKGLANGLATLDANSKIPTSQLPALAITSTFVVNSQAAQLALTAQEGDAAVRTDLNKSYIQNGGTSGTMADWQELLTPTDQVLSVNGQTGTVTLTKASIGLGNVDNTSDANKPISTVVAEALATKVDKVNGKQLSTEDYSSAEKTKLSGISPGATANQTDSYLVDRANHTGTQTAATISDLSAATDSRITAQKGVANGIASLDSNSKVPVAQIPALPVYPAAFTGGVWINPLLGVTVANGTALGNANQIFALPFFVPRRITVSDLGARVTAAISTTFQLAIYNARASDGLPGTLVGATGDMSGATATTVSSDITGPDVILEPGVVYWFCVNSAAAGLGFTAPVAAAPVAASLVGALSLPALAGTGAVQSISLSSPVSYGSWPDMTGANWARAYNSQRFAAPFLFVSGVP